MRLLAGHNLPQTGARLPGHGLTGAMVQTITVADGGVAPAPQDMAHGDLISTIANIAAIRDTANYDPPEGQAIATVEILAGGTARADGYAVQYQQAVLVRVTTDLGTVRTWIIDSQVGGLAPSATLNVDLDGRSFTAWVSDITGPPVVAPTLVAMTAGGSPVTPSGAGTAGDPWTYVVPSSASSTPMVVEAAVDNGIAPAWSDSDSSITVAADLTAPTITASDSLSGRTLTISRTGLTGNPVPGVSLTTLTLDGANVLGDAMETVAGQEWTYAVPSSVSAQTVAWEITASNGIGSDATASGSEVVAADLFAPIAAGGLSDLELIVDEAMTPVDVSADFSGTAPITYALAPSSDALPAGLSLSSAGSLSGTPTAEVSRTIVVRGTNVHGFADTAFEITVAAVATNPTVTITGYTDGTDTGTFNSNLAGTAYIAWYTESGGAPALGGSGFAGGGLVETVSMGAITVGSNDLTAAYTKATIAPADRLIIGVVTGAGGLGTSDPVAFIPNIAPAAFVDADWSVATGSGPGELDVTIASLPEAYQHPIIDLEYDLDASGTWVSSGGTTSFTITGAGDGVSRDVRLRAVNSDGTGAAGNTETATSGEASTEVTWTGILADNFTTSDDADYTLGAEVPDAAPDRWSYTFKDAGIAARISPLGTCEMKASSGLNRNMRIIHPAAATDDQAIQATLGFIPASSDVRPVLMVRHDEATSVNATCVRAMWKPHISELQLTEFASNIPVSGKDVTFTGISLQPGDVIRLEVVGTTAYATVERGGTVIYSNTLTGLTVASGKAGYGCFAANTSGEVEFTSVAVEDVSGSLGPFVYSEVGSRQDGAISTSSQVTRTPGAAGNGLFAVLTNRSGKLPAEQAVTDPNGTWIKIAEHSNDNPSGSGRITTTFHVRKAVSADAGGVTITGAADGVNCLLSVFEISADGAFDYLLDDAATAGSGATGIDGGLSSGSATASADHRLVLFIGAARTAGDTGISGSFSPTPDVVSTSTTSVSQSLLHTVGFETDSKMAGTYSTTFDNTDAGNLAAGIAMTILLKAS